MIAAQKDLDYYYIITPHVYLEILDEYNNEVPDGNIGRVVVTRLDGYSMPLIRYANGDLAIKLPKNRYPEKRDLAFPLLEMIVGRNTDIVYTTSGKFLIVHFFTGIFEFYSEIKQFKVIQRELTKIEIEYIAGKGFHPDVLHRIEDSIAQKLGERLTIDWKEVQSIKPTPSGKPQIIESFIAGRGESLS
jgi:phenylacetate-CoA ligase